MNIIGVVVRIVPESYPATLKRLEGAKMCELYFQDEALSKAVVVLEGADDSEVLWKMRQLEAIEGVLGADLIHLSSEEAPADGVQAVPPVLEDSIDARSIRYGGSVYSWMEKP